VRADRPNFWRLERIMLKHYVALGVVWVALASVMWMAVVPALISPSTFGWLNLVLIVALVAMAGTASAARPTSSIARVLYDVEHPSDSRR
jgi:FtsH-binding integral membrane protein